jgi:hypothetical protein
MAKRTPDTTGSDAPKTPERRRRTTESTGKTTAAAKPRGRRKTDIPAGAPDVATAADQGGAAAIAEAPAPTPVTAEAAIEAPASTKSRPPATFAPTTTAPGAAIDVQVPHEDIALRAYHLYLERGGQPGDEFLDWVTAERELKEQLVLTR